MKTQSKKSAAGKIASLAIVAALLAGALATSGLAEVSAGGGIVAKLFIFSLVAVIVLQVVPGVMLLGAMFKGVCSVVGNRQIIIADKDARYRNQMADYFRKAGYGVETAESVEQVLNSVMEKQAPVLLLGSDFAQKVSSSDLIHLLKKCSRHLHIIMVSEEMSLAQARQVRQEGIFFHALKPATESDTEELGQVVACVFEHQKKVHNIPGSAQSQPTASVTATGGRFGRANLMRALPWIAGMVALMLGASLIPWAAAQAAFQGTSLGTLIFFGFCALIVIGQMLPIFRIKLKLGRMFSSQTAKEGAPRSGK